MTQMKPVAYVDVQRVEADARAMRAQAFMNGARFIKTWIQARLAAKPGAGNAQHG